MRNLKLYNNARKRIVAFALATTMLGGVAISFSGCNKKEENTSNTSAIQTIVEDTNNKIDTLLPEANEEITDTATLMLLLNLLAEEDENGKISADTISQFKSNIDANDMINEFNSFLDMVEQKAILEGEVKRISSVLPQELNNDTLILSNIEAILQNVIKYYNDNNKDGVAKEFDKIYTLFVEEKEIELNGTTFEIRDLTYSSRAVASMYAETIAYYARNYISEEQYTKIDERTDDQNNKAYIKSTLEILDNQMEEKSEVDVIELFDNKYEEVKNLLNGKVNLSDNTIKNLVNYINLKYIDSDKVAAKDKKQILQEYTDEKVNDVITGIGAINKYNLNNQGSIIPFSAFLVDNYLVTETGKTDKIALDFAQYNSIMLINTTDNEIDYIALRNNPYFENVYKYFTKQNFNHIQNDENGKEINNDIIWQEISDGTNFVNYQVILYSLNNLSQVDNLDNYIDKIQTNLGESIQYIQNTIMEECQKVDIHEYVKAK